MSNPFDDPDVKSAFRAANVVHKPGLAADLMRELAPFLAEEGVDIDDPTGVDFERLNAVMGRAMVRRSVELSTPVGEQRDYAVTLLRVTAEAIDEGFEDLARAVIHSIEPAPTDPNKAAASHVMGLCMELLDSWHGRAEVAFSSVRITAWDARSRAAAIDMIALAKKARAFDPLTALTRKYRGFVVLEAGMLAVAASLQSWAASEDTTVRELGARVLAE